MSLAPRLDLRQSQSLVMTPQLQQAIRLLALSNLEVEGFIAEEIEKNPLLDSGSGDDDGAPFEVPEAPASGEPAGSDELLMTGGAGGETLDIDPGDTFHHDSPSDGVGSLDGSLGLSATGSGGYDEAPDLDSLAGDDVSLADHLLQQAGASVAGADLFIASAIIDQIDECGYLSGSLLDIATRLGVPLARVEAVLSIVQTFDPSGVGARSLAECLTIQAKEADRYDPCMARLIDNLDLVARGALPQLRRVCDVDDEDLADMIRELRGYDPKPGCRFGGERTQSVVPDLFVAPRGDGWAVEINGATLPRVLVNRGYYAELSANGTKASKAWLSDCLASANWLVKALDQRQRTILKVATELVKQQEGFFRHGVAHLRPLTLARVAEAIEMHESTVSRVTSNKYLSCPRGLFELKYFFTSAIQSADGGEAVSALAVKDAIRSLIAAEDPRKILSDDTLVELLQAKGFDIARRTVAKYRESLGLGSSVQRRRQKALGG
ncbi:RNA polymerase factor sigma-54 [Sphingomonas sp. VNH70]|uniref:RNA polymerase factor sigma-54 n=1 Tax=Sphingomonas silueang TaxID=3156617 RepID=UPI0032B4AC88